MITAVCHFPQAFFPSKTPGFVLLWYWIKKIKQTLDISGKASTAEFGWNEPTDVIHVSCFEVDLWEPGTSLSAAQINLYGTVKHQQSKTTDGVNWQEFGRRG